jgi:Putative Flp pilus-assembly TadE/G-like
MARVHDQRGGVMVMVAVWLPVLLVFLAFVLDFGNWLEHKRHLQMQVDAAALAGADVYAIPCSSATNAQVTADAHGYAGGTTFGDGSSNRQVSADRNVTDVVNSTNFPSQGGAGDGDVCAPCPPPLDFPNERCVDVKATDANLPMFVRALSLFGGSGVVPAINAHARVSIQALTTRSGALPLAIPDVNPVQGAVQFIDESTGTLLAQRTLAQAGTGASGLAIWDSKAAPWSTSALPAAATPAACGVPSGYACIGVRVILSGRQVGDPSSFTCGQTLVECYALTSANGILYVRGFSSAGTPTATTAPIGRGVTLSPGTCTDGYFEASTTSCAVAVTARIAMASDGTPASPQSDFKITAFGGGCGNKGCALTYQSTAGGVTSWATTSANYVPIGAASGGNPIELRWEKTKGTIAGATCKNGGSNPCTGSFGTVGRAFAAAATNAGPIQVASVSDNGSPSNSLQVGTAHSLTVQIGITGSLKDAQSVSDAPVPLRVVGGSQNQSIDCDPSKPNLRDEIGTGCTPSYTVNTGQACPSSAPSLWATAQPWSCVATQTGGANGQVTQGMQDRILGGSNSCTAPNNWSQFPNFPAGDPRIVPLFLTPFGTFDGSGNDVVPVQGFAYFYVTGWGGNGNGGGDPCPGADQADPGFIVGHFIQYVEKLDSAGGSGQACDPNTFTSCVAVMTQ